MGVEDEFVVPAGNAVAIQQAAGRLAQVATSLHDSGTGIGAERTGMAKAWTGPAGSTAVAEVTAQSTVTLDYGKRAESGSKVVGVYAKALQTAQDEVETIRKQARIAYEDALAYTRQVRSRVPHQAWTPEDERDTFAGQFNPKLAQLRAKYQQVTGDLKKTASTQSAALTAVLPQYKKGMTAAQVGAATRESVTGKLPMLQKLEGETRANELFGKLQPYIDKNEQIPAELLDQIEANTDNPYFATTLLGRLGPQAPNQLIQQMKSTASPTEYNRRAINDFGKLLAVATRDGSPTTLSDEYLDKLVQPMDQHNGAGVAYAWGLSQFMHYGKNFGRRFLDRFGDKLYALDRDQQHGPDGDYSLGYQMLSRTDLVGGDAYRDPRVTYFAKLGENADAAQDFFGQPDRVEYYLGPSKDDDEHYLEDGGESLGNALVAATTVHRGEDAAAQTSAQITGRVIHTVGAEPHDWLDKNYRGEVDAALAKILNAYDDDVYYALSRSDYGGAADTVARKGNPELGTPGWGVEFAAADLHGVLAQVDHNTDAYRSVVEQQLATTKEFLATKLAIARTEPGERDSALQSYARGYGLVMRELLTTHVDTQHALGRIKDLDNVHDLRVADNMAGALGDVMGLVPGVNVVTLGVKLGRRAILPDAYTQVDTTDDAGIAQLAAVKKVNEWYSRTLSSMIVDVQGGGGFTGTKADAATWLVAHNYGADARFVDADGKVLATRTDAQEKAFQTWLTDPENNGVRYEMTKMFTTLDAAGGQKGGN